MNRKTERDLIQALLKTAELGGAGNDQSFEQSLAAMASAYIREKAPSLEPYMLGFQVLDRSDDGKKAVGVTGFSIGKTTVLAPIFWLNGELKGHEMMVLPEFDLCLPLKENWLNHMLQRKPPMIGQPIDKARVTREAKQPDLRRLTRSPYKTGAEIPTWAAYGSQLLKLAMDGPPPETNGNLLIDFITEVGRPAFEAFQRITNVLPKTAELALSVHGDRLITALEAAQTKYPKRAAVLDNDDKPKKERPDVRVLSYQQSLSAMLPPDLADDEVSRLIQDGIVVSDKRTDDESSRAYTLDVSRVIDGPYAPAGRSKKMMVVDMDGSSPHDSVQSEPSDIWCIQQYSEQEYRKTLRGLPELGSLGADDQVILVDESGLGTVAFNADNEVGSDDGERVYNFNGHGDFSSDYALKSKNRLEETYRDSCYSGNRLMIDKKDQRGLPFRIVHKTLYVSPRVKKITTQQRWKSQLQLGQIHHLNNLFDLAFAKVALHRDGDEFRISVNGGRRSRPLMPKSALSQLVLHHGLREAAARDLIKTATVSRNGVAFVKYASGYLSNIESHGPAWPTEPPQGQWQGYDGDTVPVEEGYGVSQRADMPQETPEEQDEVNRFHHENTRGVAQEAAESGMTDVFDASMIISLLRAMRDDQIIDRYIPALAKAMDATARLLIGLYWHRDDFAERYGDKDVPDLEDGMRNLLEGLGDMTLKLKQKTVNPYPESQDLGVNLTDLAGAS